MTKDYYAALNLLGTFYDKRGQRKLALECYLKSSRECDIALFNYGSLLIQMNKYEICIEKTDENNEKFEEIKKIMERYIDKHPEDPDGYYELGLLYSWKDQDIKYQHWQKAFDLGKYVIFHDLFYYYKQQISKNNNFYDRGSLINKVKDMADKSFNKVIEINESQNEKQLSNYFINRLGVVFSTPHNYISINYGKAVRLWLIILSISENDPDANYNIGLSYLKGEGLEKDLQKAFYHFKKSSSDPDSQREIGAFYENGYIEETPKNIELAMEWYKKSANYKYRADYESCMKIVELTNDIKEKSKYYLKAIDSIRYSESKKNLYKNMKFPKEILLYWHDKINVKIPKLKKKIVELECRPPTEGGKLYLEALENFKQHVKQ